MPWAGGRSEAGAATTTKAASSGTETSAEAVDQTSDLAW